MSKKQIDAASEFLGAEESRIVGEIGGHLGIDVVDKPMPADAMAMEAFMNEPITIIINPASDPDEPQLVRVAVNGVNQFMPRGSAVDVKRKYVEVLARAKRTDFTQSLDDRMGEAMNHLRAMPSLRFPFSILHDPNPNGQPWIKGVLAEAR